MSALTPKAEIDRQRMQVRLVPSQADIVLMDSK